MKYTGDCLLTRMVWSGNGVELSQNDDSSWMNIRSAILKTAFNGDKNSQIEYLVDQMMKDDFPLLRCSENEEIYTKGYGDWHQFIYSWAEVMHMLDSSAISSVWNDEEMSETIEEYNLQVVLGETVDQFNERIWNEQVNSMMDAFSDDFNALRCAIDAARLLIRGAA